MTSSTKTAACRDPWRSALQSIALVAALVGAGTPVHAAALAADPVHEATPSQAERDPIASAQREAYQLHTAEITLSRAIEIAMARHDGARVVDVSFDGTAATPVFRVLTATGTRIVEERVNAATGAIEGSDMFSEIAQLDEVDRRNVRTLLRGKLDLSDAVRVAEKQTSGMAVGAGLLRLEGGLRFGVVVLVGDRLTQVILDPPEASTLR